MPFIAWRTAVGGGLVGLLLALQNECIRLRETEDGGQTPSFYHAFVRKKQATKMLGDKSALACHTRFRRSACNRSKRFDVLLPFAVVYFPLTLG